MGTLVLLLIVLGLGYRATAPEDRVRLVRAAVAAMRRVENARSQPDPFRDALRARTRRLFATPALVALNATIFVLIVFGAGALSDPTTLVGWGGNLGPRTTNGEWWRLLTAMFVHSGMLHLLINVAALVQLGLILERLVGPWAFATVYVASGLLAGLGSLSADPVSVSVGAAGAIFGLYGLLLASGARGVLHRSNMTIPPKTMRKLAPAAGLFILYNVAVGGFESAAAGLVAGFVCGLAVTVDASEHTPSPRLLGAVMATAAAVVVAAAIPLRGIADVRAEISRVVALEDHTANAYKTAADRLKSGRTTTEDLAQVIDGTIMPEIEAAQTRVKGLDRVPPEHQPLVADAEEYLRLRHESWRLRAELLHKTNRLASREAGRTIPVSSERSRLRAEAQYRADMVELGNVEGAERTSLEAFHKLRAIDQK